MRPFSILIPMKIETQLGVSRVTAGRHIVLSITSSRRQKSNSKDVNFLFVLYLVLNGVVLPVVYHLRVIAVTTMKLMTDTRFQADTPVKTIDSRQRIQRLHIYTCSLTNSVAHLGVRWLGITTDSAFGSKMCLCTSSHRQMHSRQRG